VFVTGHTGFKGAWLVAWLLELGAEVAGYALAPAYRDGLFELLGLEDRIRHTEADIRDLERLRRAIGDFAPEFVFHLAAQALVRAGYRDPKTTFDVNVGGSVNILEAARGSRSVRALVFVTSDKCYQNHEWVWGYRENDPLGGKDPYSASKGCAELVFRAYLDSYFIPEGRVNAASARSGNVIGGGDWAEDRLVPDCMRALLAGERLKLRNPSATRPWQHVLDPLYGYLLLAARLFDPGGRHYCSAWNFGPEVTSNRTVMELARDLTRLWGAEENTVEVAGEGPREAGLLSLNCDKAHHLLRWRPLRRYEDCLRDTVSWYKAFGRGEHIRSVTIAQIHEFMRGIPQERLGDDPRNTSRNR
jgi:CDP-glucose 4,6-dehydratase